MAEADDEPSRDVVRLVNAAMDQQNQRGRPVTVLHLTEADWLAIRPSIDTNSVAAPTGPVDDLRPRYRLIPIERSRRPFSFAELAPQEVDGRTEAPWIPLDDSAHITVGGSPFASQREGDALNVTSGPMVNLGPAGPTVHLFESERTARPKDHVTYTATVREPPSPHPPAPEDRSERRGGGLPPAAATGAAAPFESPALRTAAGTGVAAGGAAAVFAGTTVEPQAGNAPQFAGGGSVLRDLDVDARDVEVDDTPPLDSEPAERAEAIDSFSAELVRPTPPDAAQLPREAPASLTFAVVEGRIALSNEPPPADLSPDDLAAMLAAASASTDEAIDALRNTNADGRLVAHLERLRGLLSDEATQPNVFRIGKEPGYLRRQATTLRNEGNDFAADAVDDLAHYLERCANQFPVWVKFVRNDLAAKLSAEEVALAPEIARRVAAAVESPGVEALVESRVARAFRELADQDQDAFDDETGRRLRAADVLGSVRNFFGKLPNVLGAAVAEEIVHRLLDLLLVHAPEHGQTIVNFIVNAPGWTADPTSLIGFLRQFAVYFGLPMV